MSAIVVGRFQLQEQTSRPVKARQAAGFDGPNGVGFFANPPDSTIRTPSAAAASTIRLVALPI
jgi:hypothetical protein